MAKAGGGGGGGGGGGAGGGGIGIEFSTDPQGDTLYGQEAGGRREALLTVPLGFIGGPHRGAAQDFISRTSDRLKRAGSETEVMDILEQAEAVLGDIATANRFLEPVPSLPW